VIQYAAAMYAYLDWRQL